MLVPFILHGWFRLTTPVIFYKNSVEDGRAKAMAKSGNTILAMMRQTGLPPLILTNTLDMAQACSS